MPANHKVSVAWQIVFTFLPVVNFWAFYRIRKLRKYVLYIVVAQVVLSVIIVWYGYNGAYSFMGINPLSPVVLQLATVAALVVHGFAIYLVIICSRQHNRQFDQTEQR